MKIIIDINLPGEAGKETELSLLLNRIANQIEEGYTSGIEVNYSWKIKD